jgi:O-antigen ligase
MVGLLAVGATAFVMMPKRPKYLAALLVTVLVTARFTGPELYERYVSAFVSADERDNSAQSRVDLWRDCLQVVAQYPILGVGPANWRVIAQQYGWPPGKSAHSVWMEAAAEIGIPGALALLMFFLITAVRLWPLARATLTDANRYEVLGASGVILSMIGWVVSGQFVSAQGLETPYFVALVGVGVLRSAMREAPVRSAERAPAAPVLRPRPLRPLTTARSVAVKR